jgi:tRNA(fMet)-specific endonuclease VapC
VPSLVLFDHWYGVARSERWRENAERVRVFLSGNINVVTFDAQYALAAGNLRAALQAAGTPIGPYDLLIAAQALRLRATLVTSNTSEFGRVRGLRGVKKDALADWKAGKLPGKLTAFRVKA